MESIEVLPDDCIAHAISLTSPRDASCLSAVSTTFRSAASYDSVWNSFLPSDLESILARADRPVDFSSKKELFFRLCDQPILLDGGKMVFSLDRSSGGKCFMLSARELDIRWADTDPHWRWVPEPDSSLGHPLQEASVELGTESSIVMVCLRPSVHIYAQMSCSQRIWSQKIRVRSRRVLQLRDDGWMEIELGEFYNSGEEDAEVAVSLLEAKERHWKNGLIIEGIEIKPKKSLVSEE